MFSLLRMKSFAISLILVLALGLTVSSLNAQYFGRNKVQYKNFDFKILKTEHFDIYFYPEMQKAAKQAARMAERWYARLSRILSHELKGRQILILYASFPDFQQTTTISSEIPEGTGGVTESFKRRIILPLGASLDESDHVIGHELVHAFQYSLTSRGRSGYDRTGSTMNRLPLWFVEGLAEYLSIGPVDPHTSMWMRDVTQADKLPTIKKLQNSYKYFPYRYGQAVWAYISGRWGDDAVMKIMRSVSRTGDYETVLKKVLGISTKQLSKDWHEAMKKAYTPVSKATQLTDKSSRILFKGTKDNRYNISPTLSPDGKQLIFLSTRDLFSIDLYLADAEAGKVSWRLTKTAIDPHFESIQFIKSSGSWDAEGKRFVFGAARKARSVLSIVNVENKKTEREIPFTKIGEILNPTWSPDGRFIAFSALEGGLSDIFIYDLETDQLKKMTNDSFADLYPSWSPDGLSIAFVTDRFTTDLSILNIGDYELALMDPETGDIKRISGFKGAKHINPQWSLDSKDLYFISDINGISNIYKVNLDSNKIDQVTNFFTGVTGITELSPAFSVAPKTGQLVYSLYGDDKFSIYSMDLLGSERTEALAELPDGIYPALLPPRKKPEGEVLGLLKNPLYGLPEEKEFAISDYKPKLGLDYVAQPQAAVGVDRFGTYAAGGIAMFFSDILGYHNLYGLLQVSSRILDSAAAVGYQNTKSRLNWGASVQRIPYVYGGFNIFVAPVLGQMAQVEQEFIQRQIYYDASAFAAYPFSQVQRVELTGGFRMIDYDLELRTRAYSMVDGTELIREKEKLPSPDSLSFGYASAALVYDSSLFGATSPLVGQSYILQVTPNIGSINFTNILADYRRYFMPVKPFTLAFRIMHYGRYGKGAEDERFYPLYIGYDSFIRGYDYNSLRADELDVYDRLRGTKLLVANAELRFPLFGALGIGEGYYGILPIDFNAFFDSGVAWTNSDKAWFLGGERKLLKSAGVGLRMNVFGYIILGLNYVYPFDRPHKGWHFQFSFYPGF